jgi:hypothetical protein
VDEILFSSSLRTVLKLVPFPVLFLFLWLLSGIKKMQIKLATTCNKNEQQQDAKNNADL